jgi:ABC-type transport system involved in cytochrome c biogenesis permease component
VNGYQFPNIIFTAQKDLTFRGYKNNFFLAYVLLKVAGKPGWWVLLFFIPIVNLVIAIIAMIGVAQNFGKGGGFVVGLILLPIIFYPVLAFGSAQYRGIEPAPTI